MKKNAIDRTSPVIRSDHHSALGDPCAAKMFAPVGVTRKEARTNTTEPTTLRTNIAATTRSARFSAALDRSAWRGTWGGRPGFGKPPPSLGATALTLREVLPSGVLFMLEFTWPSPPARLRSPGAGTG